MNSKGQGKTVTYVLGLIVLSVFTFYFCTQILPKELAEIYSFVSQASSEAVSRNLAGAITISAAAPNEISIDYGIAGDFKYGARISDRLVNLKLLTQVFGMQGDTQSKIAVDATCDQPVCDFQQVNSFNVKKWEGESGYVCKVNAE